MGADVEEAAVGGVHEPDVFAGAADTAEVEIHRAGGVVVDHEPVGATGGEEALVAGGFIAVEPLREKPAGVSEPEEWGAVGVAEEAVVGRDFQLSVDPRTFSCRGSDNGDNKADGGEQAGEMRAGECGHGIGRILWMLRRESPWPSGRSGCKIR